jgi:acyl-CoA synthetase (AMP-forming)/AMP-acid ligase II
MGTPAEGNFAGWLVSRLGKHAYLIDAATGSTIEPDKVPGLIAAYASAFRDAGLQPGDPILLASSLSPLSCLAYLGAMYAGFIVAPVEERMLAASGPKLIETTGAKAIWTELKPAFAWLRENPILSLHGDLAAGKTASIGAVPRVEADLAALMATSGSTGTPRFVKVTHGNLRSNTEAIIRSQHLRDDERAMLILPLSYCFGASVLHSHLAQGGGVVFDKRFMFPDKVLQAIAQYQCTSFAGVPTAYNVLLQRSSIRSIAMPSLRRMLQAGGALARHSIEEMRKIVFHAAFYVMYGQTEATSRISCLDPKFIDEKAGSVGLPLDNLEIRVADESGEALPKGSIGELWVKGPSICPGYLNDPDETDLVFRDGWLRTRDIGSLDDDGFIWVRGRKGAFVKMRGHRVSFTEVEHKVAAIPGVAECAAHAVAHPEAGEALILMVVQKEGTQLRAEEMYRQLPAHWAFDSVRFVAELPKTANGKLSRAAVAEQLKASHARASHANA